MREEKADFLFVGGPWNGKVVTLEADRNSWRVAVPIKPNPREDRECPYSVVQYTRDTISLWGSRKSIMVSENMDKELLTAFLADFAWEGILNGVKGLSAELERRGLRG